MRAIWSRDAAPRLALGWVLLAAWARSASGQISLSDDIIFATQGKENAERNRKSALGRAPGTQESPYHRAPGSGDILLGQDPQRRLAPLRRLAQRPKDPSELSLPRADRAEFGQGLAPAIERLEAPSPLPPRGAASGSDSEEAAPLDEGSLDGLTLEAAIDRLVHFNHDLRSKSFEIPQAEADILTAGLRENPLLFYSTGSIPYGSYSPKRPGDINHGLSIVLPVDYSGKRKARVALAQREKCVLEAQYRNAVRLAMDDLYTAYVDALAERQAVRSAERGLALLGRLLADAKAKPGGGEGDQDAVDDLTVEYELAAISVGNERARYLKARRRLTELLDLPPEQAEAIELRGSLRVPGVQAPPLETLTSIAIGRRPDLAAFRQGVARASAELDQERAERTSDLYLLYTPFEYRDNSQVGLQSATSWGAGIFVSVPLFNRNQGNLKRARLNVQQSRVEVTSLDAKVVGEVLQAYRDFENTREDVERLETTALPALRRKQDRARRKFEDGRIGLNEFLAVQRDGTSLVRYHRDILARHRRNSLKINTAVGHRVIP